MASTNDLGSPSSGLDSVTRRIEASYRRVVEPGKGRRWYDGIFRLIEALLWSPLGRRSPTWAKRPFRYFSSLIYQINELERMRLWDLDDPMHNVFVSADEHVNVPGIWVMDYFPPSCIADLNSAIVRQRWDGMLFSGLPGEGNREVLERSRQGRGPTWWRIAEISPQASPSVMPGALRRKLPAEFSSVELLGVRIGDGLTGVIAHFTLTDAASGSVDCVWHADHEPRLVHRRNLPQVEDRMWTTFRNTQESRGSLHEAARQWLSAACPGAFAKASEQQPLMDLLLLKQYDPSIGEREDRSTEDPLRALGITGGDLTWRTSEDLPGLLLEPVSESLCPALSGLRTWTLWGQMDRVAASMSHLRNYGDGVIDHRAIGHEVNKSMTDFLVRLGLSDFLQLLREQGAEARDSARVQHGSFGRRDLKRLRQQFLTSSLDVTSVHRDVRDYNKPRNWRDREAEFQLNYVPWLRKEHEHEGREPFEPIDLNKRIREFQVQESAELLLMDKDYRDVLSTVASLGASIDAFKVQRYAISIAVVSLIVALVTLLMTLPGAEPDKPLLTDWIGVLLGWFAP